MSVNSHVRVKIIEFPVKFDLCHLYQLKVGRYLTCFRFPRHYTVINCARYLKRQGRACLLEIVLKVRMKEAVQTFAFKGRRQT